MISSLLLRDPRARVSLRLVAACSWLTLTALSLVPGQDRPHTGMSGNVEHAMAYALAGLVTRLAFQRTASRWQVLSFSTAAALFEVCQNWIPGRSPGVDNWAASTAGALFGIVVARALTHEQAGSR